MEIFLKRHVRHARTDDLLEPTGDRKWTKVDQSLNIIAAAGWQGSLRAVSWANIKSMFRYLSRGEGRSR